MNALRLIIIITTSSLCISFTTSCNSLLFVEEMPSESPKLNSLPEFINGTLELVDGQEEQLTLYSGSYQLLLSEREYLSIERISDQHIIAYSCIGITQDSLLDFIEKVKEDGYHAELRGSTLIVEVEEELIVQSFTKEGDIFYTLKKPQYEINLAKGYFVNDFTELVQNIAFMKQMGDTYYLNVLTDGNWFIIAFDETSTGIDISFSGLKNWNILNSNNNDINYITEKYPDIHLIKGADGILINSLSDKIFEEFIHDGYIFEKMVWERVDKSRTLSMSSIFWIAILSMGIVVGILYLNDILSKKEDG